MVKNSDRHSKALVTWHDTLLVPDDPKPCLAVDGSRGGVSFEDLGTHGRPCFDY